MFEAMRVIRPVATVMALRWDGQAWAYQIDDGFEVSEPRTLGGEYGSALPREVALLGVAMKENARRAELIAADGVSVRLSVSRTL